MEIVKLDELLRECLGPNKTVTGQETSRLTALGENYGSQMLALKVHTNQNDTLETVAKIPPPGEFIHKMFNIPVTFKNEIDFYKIIVPELQKFIKEKGLDSDYLDCFPKYYGSRLNFNQKDLADDDAVLILENLKVLNYGVVERSLGFDLKATRAILLALAKLHAVPLALKLSKPELFRQKIRPLFLPYKVFEMNEEMIKEVMEKHVKIIEGIEEVKRLAPHVREAYFATPQPFKNSPEFIKEPFATIIHTDAWVNNFMIDFAKNHCKIVDFQLGEYGSPARDVIFFLFTSVEIPVLQQYYDDLIKYYHEEFVGVLEKLGCDVAPFSFEEFLKEVRMVSKSHEFLHCMIMLEPIYATKEHLKELDEYSAEDMTQQREVSQKYKDRAAFIVKEFINKGYI